MHEIVQTQKTKTRQQNNCNIQLKFNQVLINAHICCFCVLFVESRVRQEYFDLENFNQNMNYWIVLPC